MGCEEFKGRDGVVGSLMQRRFFSMLVFVVSLRRLRSIPSAARAFDSGASYRRILPRIPIVAAEGILCCW